MTVFYKYPSVYSNPIPEMNLMNIGWNLFMFDINSRPKEVFDNILFVHWEHMVFWTTKSILKNRPSSLLCTDLVLQFFQMIWLQIRGHSHLSFAPSLISYRHRLLPSCTCQGSCQSDSDIYSKMIDYRSKRLTRLYAEVISIPTCHDETIQECANNIYSIESNFSSIWGMTVCSNTISNAIYLFR